MIANIFTLLSHFCFKVPLIFSFLFYISLDIEVAHENKILMQDKTITDKHKKFNLIYYEKKNEISL